MPDTDRETDAPAGDSADAAMDRLLLELLVCPLTRTRLEYDRGRQELVSRAAGLAFPIRDGIAMMTVDAARRLDAGS